jgi:small-conductance mechanosensitive channel
VSASAAPVASVLFSVIFIVGLVVALGFVHPDSLETIPEDLFEFLPRLLAAVIVLIGGNIFATLARTATDKALRGTAAHRFGPALVRWTILSFTAILAAAQLGVDTTIINIAAAALLFGLAAAMALLVGLGGRGVAAEVAAGRAWRTTLAVGDRIAAADVGGAAIDGVVVEIHPTMIELDVDGRSVLVPNSQLLDVVVERIRDADA